LKSLVALNIELAKLEGKQKVTALGMAAGFAGGAVALVFYAIGFGFAAAAAGLNESLPLWLSLLIVAAVLLIFAAVLGLLARRSAGELSTPLPSAAIEEAERTLKALEDHV
jgi:membrane protein implicated in regulation of membrane protease activity